MAMNDYPKVETYNPSTSGLRTPYTAVRKMDDVLTASKRGMAAVCPAAFAPARGQAVAGVPGQRGEWRG